MTMREQGAGEGLAPMLVTLSSGVVFRLRKPSAWALTEVERQMTSQQPRPPVFRNEDRDRDEPNEADPDYQAALGEFVTRLTERKYEVIIATGTQIESVPDSVPPLESAAWLEMLAAIGISMPANMTAMERYIRWVKYVAAPDNGDWPLLYMPLRREVGTAEEDVAQAAETFRSSEERPPD